MEGPSSKRVRINPSEIKAMVTESDGEISCSIEETNRIRALLGMKPLIMNDDHSKEAQAVQNLKIKKDEEAKQMETAEILARLEKAKNKRLMNAKLEGKTLSASDDVEDMSLLSAADWVNRSRMKQSSDVERAKEQAAISTKKSQKMNGDNNEDNISRQGYHSGNLKGLKVMHGAEDFGIGDDVILTLADSNILDVGTNGVINGLKDDEDVLQNPLMAEEEQRQARERRAKRAKQPVYSGYDDAEFDSTLFPGAKPSLLAHYDQEKKSGPKLVLGDDGEVLDSRGNVVSSSTAAGPLKHTVKSQSLTMETSLSSDFYTPAEFAVFHKPKKDKKLRKIRKKAADEEEEDFIAVLESSAAADDGTSDRRKRDGTVSVAARAAEEQATQRAAYEAAASRGAGPTKPEQTTTTSTAMVAAAVATAVGVPPIVQEEDDVDMAQSLARARRLALSDRFKSSASFEDKGAVFVQQLMRQQPAPAVKMETSDDFDEIDADGRRKDGTLIFTSTTEFTTRLQARINEVARSKSEAIVKEQEKRDMEFVLKEATKEEEELADEERMDVGGSVISGPSDSLAEAQEEEADEGEGVDFMHKQPLVATGMAATLALLKNSGDLNARRNDELAGRAKDSREYDPSSSDLGVKVEYRDEHGRKLTQKEAFRQLSYRFHGFGPGKKKQEKRLREMQAQSKEFTSKAPLETGTMKSLTKTQEATGKAHVTIQGAASANSAAVVALVAKNKAKAERKALQLENSGKATSK